MDPARIAKLVEQACVDEVSAPKPGNVHGDASFDNLTAQDFFRAARAIAPIMAEAPGISVGKTILTAVKASSEVTASNTNLGMILLFAPICASLNSDRVTFEGVEKVVDELTVEDAVDAYEAIRLAGPGGMQEANEQDIQDQPTVTLKQAMVMAAGWDSIALEYSRGFQGLFAFGRPVFVEALQAEASREEAIVWCHLRWMAERPDTLIARKCGPEVAWESQRRVKRVIGAVTQRVAPHGPVPRVGYLNSEPMRRLDDWLRADGNKRNPGTSADLVAATILVHDLSQAC